MTQSIVFRWFPNRLTNKSIKSKSGITKEVGHFELKSNALEMNDGDSNGSSSSCSSPLRHFRHCLPPSCFTIQDMLHYPPSSPSFADHSLDCVAHHHHHQQPSNEQQNAPASGHFTPTSNGLLDQAPNLGNTSTTSNLIKTVNANQVESTRQIKM